MYKSKIFSHKISLFYPFLILVLILSFSINLFAQNFGTGLLLTDSLYKDRPVAAPLMRGDYSNLPKASSMKNFSPTPGNQGPYGTCAGWSTAYSARTILEALHHNWDQAMIDSNAFSPSFVYNQIRTTDNCNGGTSLLNALDVLKDFGGVKMDQFGYNCDRKVTALDKAKAFPYRIIEYRDVVSSSTLDKTKYVKKCIAESHPVVIAFDCPYTFSNAHDVWNPDSTDYKRWNRGHAITVIGYDDNKYSGAFQLINSWGTRWGNDGFTWIRYKDFDYFCKYAFELIDKTKLAPDVPDLTGSLQFKLSSGQEMGSKFNGKYFEMTQSYPSGTLFELRISNNEPAYVYAFSSDLTYKTYRIFPFTKRMLAYLPYRENNVAIPDENSYNMLDEQKGKSYYCFLYSKEHLDLDSIMQKVEDGSGTFWQRITHVLSDKLVDPKNIDYKYENKIKFEAKSEGKFVVPVLIEINNI